MAEKNETPKQEMDRLWDAYQKTRENPKATEAQIAEARKLYGNARRRWLGTKKGGAAKTAKVAKEPKKTAKVSNPAKLLGEVDAVMADRKVSVFVVQFRKANGETRSMLAMKPKAAAEAGLIEPVQADGAPEIPDLHIVLSLDVFLALRNEGVPADVAAKKSFRSFYGTAVQSIRPVA